MCYCWGREGGGGVPRRLAKEPRAVEAAKSTTDTSKTYKAMPSGLKDVVAQE